MRQPYFLHAVHVIYPTQRTHANAVLDASDSNVFIKLIGGDSVGPSQVNSDAAHFPEPSMVPAGQSIDKASLKLRHNGVAGVVALTKNLLEFFIERTTPGHLRAAYRPRMLKLAS